MHYAGSGPRETPPDIVERLESIGARLARMRWTLRHGGAPGAEEALLRGAQAANGRIDAYLPWSGFNRTGPLPGVRISEELMEVTRRHHPCWRDLTPAQHKLMARATAMILGPNLDCPATFLICWARHEDPNGASQAIRIAKAFDVPIYDLSTGRVREDRLYKEAVELVSTKLAA